MIPTNNVWLNDLRFYIKTNRIRFDLKKIFENLFTNDHSADRYDWTCWIRKWCHLQMTANKHKLFEGQTHLPSECVIWTHFFPPQRECSKKKGPTRFARSWCVHFSCRKSFWRIMNCKVWSYENIKEQWGKLTLIKIQWNAGTAPNTHWESSALFRLIFQADRFTFLSTLMKLTVDHWKCKFTSY